MKKMLFLLSLALITAWIVLTFMVRNSTGGHILLVLALLCYIRSLMVVESSPNSIFSNRKW